MPKLYPVDQSPLYRLNGLKQLEKCLDIKLNRLDKLLKDGSYRTWFNDKGREIQHPLGWLAAVHKKIARYLSRIETPDYVYHKKGRSHVANASEHKGYRQVAKTDISGYFPNTSRKMIKDMFINHFHCARDVAGILADICCFQTKHLPTGSTISGYVAFFANKDLFDRVAKLAKEKNCLFTLYVDDLTLSGIAATKSLINEVRLIIKQEGRSSQDKKTHSFSTHAPKLITGVVIKGNRCLLPNQRHKDINDIKNEIQLATDEIHKETLKKSLKGHLLAAKQIANANENLEDNFPKLIYS